MHEHDIVAVHLDKRLAMLRNDDIIPISDFFDEDGVECEAGTAVTAIAGPGPQGKWAVIDLRDYTVEMAEQ